MPSFILQTSGSFWLFFASQIAPSAESWLGVNIFSMSMCNMRVENSGTSVRKNPTEPFLRKFGFCCPFLLFLVHFLHNPWTSAFLNFQVFRIRIWHFFIRSRIPEYRAILHRVLFWKNINHLIVYLVSDIEGVWSWFNWLLTTQLRAIRFSSVQVAKQVTCTF